MAAANAAANSWRWLARPSAPLAPRIYPVVLSTAPFSTTNSLNAAQPKKKSERMVKVKAVYKKKNQVVVSKKPNPGDRKTFRKRIQLSSNSALPVEGLETLGPDTMTEASNAGKIFAIPDQVVDQLRGLEAFKPTQSWHLFRRPHFLVKGDSVTLTSKMKSSVTDGKALRCVLTGNRNSGKSLTLLQAMSYALLNEWVVINLPEGQDITNNNTEFSPIPDTSPMQFAQPIYCLKLLQNIYKANRAVLEKLQTKQDWFRLAGLKEGATLADLVLSAKESEFAWPTLEALWTELTLPGRPPVLFGLDGLAHINRVSAYRDPSFNPVHAHDLAIVRLFVDALSGKAPLPNGGAIIAATSKSNTHHPPSEELVISQLQAYEDGEEAPKPQPYERGYDERVYDALKTCSVIRTTELSKDEARELLGYWAASGLVKGTIDSRTVAERWALAGGGNIGEMEKASLMTQRM